jgi:hypothetical protein
VADLRERTWGKDLDAGHIGADAGAFLRELGGPTLIHVPGQRHDRLRVVTTLLHGNEPSGVRALHRWLREGAEPAVDALFFIGAVETALEPPGFAYRFLPGAGDFNRCWLPPFDRDGGDLARLVLERLRSRPPECLVDLHNNTGQNPAYGVTFRMGGPERNLVGRYALRVIHTPIELGTIVEATCEDWPTVTIECGRSGDPVADDLALVGTRRLLSVESLDLDATPPFLEVVVDPVRVAVRPGIELGFGDGPGGHGLTVSREIDRHNFELVPPHTCIGWIEAGCDWPIEAVGARGEDRSLELFVARDGRLETSREMIPVMMTTSRESALADCLFYAGQPERRLA